MGDIRSNVRLVGLTEIQFANVRSTGSFPGTAASFSTLGNVVPDSAHFMIDEPVSNEIYIEEEETPDIELFGPSKKYFVFGTRDMGTQTLLKAFGGVAAGAAWSASTTDTVYREQAVKIQGKTINGTKIKVEIPRASVKAGGDLLFAKTDSGTLAFTCNVLMPNSSTAIPPYVITQV